MMLAKGTKRGALLAVLVYGLALLGHPALTQAGFIPTDLPGCRLWLDGSDATTLWKDTAATQPVTATGDLVARWNDKSGNSFFLSQGNAGNQPTYQTASLNGLSTLYFNSDNLNRTNDIGINGNDDRTVFTVWANAVNTGQNYQHTFHMGNTNTSQAYGHSAYHPGAAGAIGNHYWGSDFNTTATGTSNPTIAASMWDGDGGSPGRDQWYVNGLDVGAINRAAIDTGTNSGALIVGSRLAPQTEGVQGNMAEVLIYNRVLSTPEANAVGFYLSRKYGITTSYPAPAAATTLTWDNTANDWATNHWNPGPVPGPSDDTTKGVVGGGNVTIPAAGADVTAHSLDLTGGQVTVGAGRTLALPYGIASTGGTLALENASKLELDYEGGSINTLSVTGSATLDARYGTVSVPNVTMASSLVKTGAGTLAVGNVPTASPGSFFDVRAGTVTAQAPNYVGTAGITLSGGTFEVTGPTTTPVPGLRGLYYNQYGTGNAPNEFNSYANITARMTALGTPSHTVQLIAANDTYPDSAGRPKGSIDFPAGGGADGPDCDQFANMGITNYWNNIYAFWKGQINVSAADAGLYGFRTASDDGSMIFIDGNTVVNNNYWQGVTWRGNATPWYNLTQGLHDVLIGFYEGGGGNGMYATWTPVRLYDYATSTYSLNTTNTEVLISGADPRFVSVDYQEINMGSTPVTVSPNTTGSVLRSKSDVRANFGPLTFGSNSDLTVTGAPTTFTDIITNGNATLNLDKRVTAYGFDDQGIAGTLNLTGTNTLSIEAPTAAAVSAKQTNFRVNSGTTLNVAGAGLLGGDPLVTLNGGTFNIAPVPASPDYPDATMMETNVSVIGSTPSTLNVATTGNVALGHLSFDAPMTLNITGSGSASFLDMSLNANGAWSLNTAIRTVVGGVSSNPALNNALFKIGAADLIVDPGTSGSSTGLGNTLIDVGAGRLGLIGANAAPGAALRLSGGGLILGSPDGSNQTYANTITAIAGTSSTLTAGTAGVGVASGDPLNPTVVTVNNLAPFSGASVTLAAEANHKLVLPNGVNSPGTNLAISQGNVQIGSAASPINLNLASLALTGGTTTLIANGGTSQLTNGLLGGGTLVTQGTFTVNPAATLNLSGQLRVDSGNLTLNAPAGNPLPLNTVAFYDFNGGSVTDGSGNGYNGTLVGNAQIVGGVLQVDGNNTGGNGYADVPSMAAQFGGNAGTVSMWVKLDNATPGDGADTGIVGFGGTGNNHYPWTDSLAYATTFRANGNRVDGIALSGAVDRASWHLLTYTSDPVAGWKMYQNTTEVTPGGFRAAVWGIGNWRLGNDPGNNAYLDGQMDNVMVLNRAITPAEIATLVAAGPTATYGGANIGDVRLGDGASLTLAGAGQPRVTSIGSTPKDPAIPADLGGPTVTGPMTLSNFGNPTAARTGSTLTIDATITNAASFNITGTGRVELSQNLTVASGGSLTAPSDVTLASQADLLIDVGGGSVNLLGTLSVADGTTLTVNTPAWVPSTANTLRGSVFFSTATPAPWGPSGNTIPRDQTALNLDGAGFQQSVTRVLTGSKAGTILTMAEDAALNVQVTGSTQNWTAWGVSFNGDTEDFITAFSGMFTPAVTGSYNFHWNNDDAGLMYIDENRNSVFEASERVAGYGWNMSGNKTLTAGTAYNVIYMAHEFGGGQGVDWRFTPPGGGEMLVDPSNPSQAGMWSTGILPGLLGDLVLGNNSTLALGGSGVARFPSITTTGATAGIQGDPMLTGGDLRVGHNPASPSDIVIGNLAVTGNLTMAAGSTYHWQYDATTTTGDMVAVTGNLTTTGDVNVGIALSGVIPDGTYDIGTVTGTPTIGGAINVLKENAYANLITTATPNIIPGSPNRIVLDLDLVDTSTWTSSTPGAIEWNLPGNWNSGLGPAPDGTRAAIVKAPAATQVATVTPAMGPQAAHTLIVDNGGHVLVQQGASLQVVNSADVLAGSSLTVNGTLSMPITSTVVWSSAQNFNATNGGYTTSTVNPVTPPDQPGPWAYGASGVGGTNAWSTPGGEVGAYPALCYEQLLTSPVLTVGSSGNLALSFDHRYFFEDTWDGGTVMVNVNGAGFTQLPGSAFTQNGYNSAIQTSDDWGYAGDMNGLAVFGSTSGGFLTSTADLGWLNAGSTVQVQFRGGWDWYTAEAAPNWAVDNVQLTQSVTGGTGTLTTAGTTTFGPNADLDVSLIRITGGVTSGPTYPSSARVTLRDTTTVRLEDGELAGGFNLTKTSTTPGSYALEVEKGLVTAHLTGPAASLRKSTAGAATLSGDVILNTMSMEDGSLVLADGHPLQVGTVAVTGGELRSERHVATIGTLQLDGGTTTLAGNAGTKITTALQGAGTLRTESDVTLDASTAFVNLSGTIHVTDNSPASAGRLTINVPAFSASTLLNGLVAHWAFNGNLNNDSANPGLNGTPNGNPVSYTTGAPGLGTGQSLRLDGSNWVSVAPPGSLSVTGTYTVAAWAQVTNASGGQNIFDTRRPSENSFDMKFQDNNRIHGDIGNGAGTWLTTAADAYFTTVPYLANTWYHIAYVVSPTGYNIYLNDAAGNLVGSGSGAYSGTPVLIDANHAINMGRYSGGGENLNGRIDDVGVWNRALTPAELQSLTAAAIPSGPARLGNLQLDPGTQLVLRGPGGVGPGTALFNTIGTEGGPTVSSSLELTGGVSGSTQKLTINGTATATNFQITGPGTVALDNSVLNVNGGSLSVPSGVTLESLGNSTINADDAGLNFQGTLKVSPDGLGNGTLTLNPPSTAEILNTLSGSVFFSTATAAPWGPSGNNIPRNETAVNLDGATYKPSGLRVFTGNKANTILTMAEAAALNVLVTGSTQNWTAWTGLFDGNTEDFITAFSGTFTPAETGSYNFHWNNDDAGLMYIDENHNSVFEASERVAGYGWNMNGNKALTAGTQYNVIYMAHEHGGGQDVWWAFTPPSGGERIVNPGDPSQAGMWSVPGGRFGNLDMAAGTQVNVANGQPVGFSSATLGDGALITDSYVDPTKPWVGGVVIDNTLTPNAFGTGHATIDGSLQLSNGLIYEWSFGKYDSDLMTILGNLDFDKAFTLRIFGMGGSIKPSDQLPLFYYNQDLYIGGLPWNAGSNPLQYTIDIGNLSDLAYAWDLSGASIQVGLLGQQQAIYITGLSAFAVPEPSTLALAAIGLAALLRRRRARAR